jgi:hypothetical protein
VEISPEPQNNPANSSFFKVEFLPPTQKADAKPFIQFIKYWLTRVNTK